MRDVYIVGAGQTKVNRDATTRGRVLATAAIQAAIDDAGVNSRQIDTLFVGNMLAATLGRQQQLGALIADYANLGNIEAVTVEAACASGAAAARMAYLTIAGGAHDVAIVCGTERMTHGDHDTVTQALATAADRELETDESFLTLNAMLMRAYIEKYRVERDAFAEFAINAHDNAAVNPKAVFHRPISIDDYMQSRIVVDPIRLYDVSPICNGAAAIVLAAGDAAEELLRDRAKVHIVASAAATAPVALERRADILKLEAIETATQAALKQAKVAHRDIDFIELHDAYTIMSVLCLESAGFMPPGAATQFAREGRVKLGGDLPMSTMGGLKARGHPVGATGVYQMVEAYLQLSGLAGPNQVPDAELGLLQNIGGTGSTVINHLLRRVG